MTQDTVTVTPHEPASLSASQRQTVAVLMLCLFFVEFNVGTVFYHARGVPPEQGGTLVAAHFAGLLAGVLGLSWLRSCRAWSSPGRSGTLLRAAFLCFLLFPSLLSQVSFQFTGYAGTDFINAFQPFLWSLHLPVAFFFFFSHVRHDRRAFTLGIAMSAGHLCWALLMPLAGSVGQESAALPSTLLENRYLPLLNVSRNLAGAAFALLCWKLAGQDVFSASGSAKRNGTGTAGITMTAGFPTRRFYLLLLPFLASFFLNGFVGYLFFARLLGRGLYPEYIHLVLALLFPLAGLYASRRGDKVLFRLIFMAVLTFAVFPLLLFLAVSSRTHQVVYFICAATHQVLLFCGFLAFARFAPNSRFPVLMFCLGWLAAAVSVPGRFLAAKALPALSVPLFPVACILRGLEREAIGGELGISARTVKFHIRSLLKKTGEDNRQRLLHFYTGWRSG